LYKRNFDRNGEKLSKIHEEQGEVTRGEKKWKKMENNKIQKYSLNLGRLRDQLLQCLNNIEIPQK
jgi:hypothetical protein